MHAQEHLRMREVVLHVVLEAIVGVARSLENQFTP